MNKIILLILLLQIQLSKSTCSCTEYLNEFEYSPEEKTLIKAADRISAYIKCLEEKNYGNMEFDIAGKRLYDSIKAMECIEAEYFIENFLEPFGLPIDSIII